MRWGRPRNAQGTLTLLALVVSGIRDEKHGGLPSPQAFDKIQKQAARAGLPERITDPI
jgi:hypothetical protein